MKPWQKMKWLKAGGVWGKSELLEGFDAYMTERAASRLTPVPADAAALLVADESATTEPTAVTGGTAEHHR